MALGFFPKPTVPYINIGMSFILRCGERAQVVAPDFLLKKF